MPTVQTTSVCWLPRDTRNQLFELAYEWRPLEVGGVLAGYWNGEHVVITDHVGPGTSAVHKTVTFLPDHNYHVSEIRRIYESSSGRDTYLGDWHSHPYGPARLSPLDKRTLRSIAYASEAQCPRPLMLLLSGSDRDWTIRVFTLGNSRRLRPREVVPMKVELY